MKKLLILSFLCVSTYVAAALSLVVEPLSGANKTAAIASIGYVKLSETTVRVFAHDGTLLSETALQDVRRVVYRETGEVATSADNTAGSVCLVYPNPTEDVLMVENCPGETVYVFGLDGRRYGSAETHNGHAAVDVSGLPTGTYLLLINTETVKFIKR